VTRTLGLVLLAVAAFVGTVAFYRLVMLPLSRAGF
jgi:hypothetical protein